MDQTEARKLALAYAMQMHGEYTRDPEEVIRAAEVFEGYLIGKQSPVDESRKRHSPNTVKAPVLPDALTKTKPTRPRANAFSTLHSRTFVRWHEPRTASRPHH